MNPFVYWPVVAAILIIEFVIFGITKPLSRTHDGGTEFFMAGFIMFLVAMLWPVTLPAAILTGIIYLLSSAD